MHRNIIKSDFCFLQRRADSREKLQLKDSLTPTVLYFYTKEEDGDSVVFCTFLRTFFY